MPLLLTLRRPDRYSLLLCHREVITYSNDWLKIKPLWNSFCGFYLMNLIYILTHQLEDLLVCCMPLVLYSTNNIIIIVVFEIINYVLLIIYYLIIKYVNPWVDILIKTIRRKCIFIWVKLNSNLNIFDLLELNEIYKRIIWQDNIGT